MDKYKDLLSSFSTLLNECKTENELIAKKNIFIKNNLSPLYKKLKDLPNDKKKAYGLEINQFKSAINDIFDNKLTQIQSSNALTNHKVIADLAIDSSNFTKGAVSPITLISNKIINFFKKLDFIVVNGNEVTSVDYNFNFLNVDADHPGRQTSESFYFNPDLMLRAHNTASSVEQMHKNNKSKDLRVISFGNVYRNDDDDLTHSHQFNQIDLVWVKEGLNVANLKWLLSSLLKYLYGNDTKVRYRLSYFPFTEPSIETDVECPICHGKGCSLCKKTGWIEILGAGMLNQKVLKMAGFKTTDGFAAGIGIDRLAMIKYSITDIRDIYSNDFRFLKQLSMEEK